MIPTQEMTSFPVWASGSGAAKVEPGAAKYAAGWLEADVVPHEWLNWLFNRASGAVTKHNAGVLSMEKEINSVLTASGQTPDVSDDDQLLDAIQYLIQQGGNAIQPVNTSTTITPIKNTTCIITAAGVTLTLAGTPPSGIQVHAYCKYAASLRFVDLTGTQVTRSAPADSQWTFTFNGTGWLDEHSPFFSGDALCL